MANMNFGVNILPKANNTYSLGNSDYKWNIFANQINGAAISSLVLPAVTSVDNGKILQVSSGAWSVGTLGDATQSTHGLMSTTDKIALDSIQNWYYINPNDFTGAATTSSNASTIINSAISAAATQGKNKVIIPPGEYWLTATIYLVSNVILCGSGMDATTLKIANGYDIDAIRVSGPTNNSGIMDLTIDGNRIENYSTFSSGHHGNAINVWLHYGRIERVRTKWIYKHSLLLNYDVGNDDDGLSFDSQHEYDQGNLNQVLWCDFTDSLLQGIMWGWRTVDSWMCYTNIGSHAANLYLEGGTSRFIGNHFDGDGDNGSGPEYNVYCGDGCTSMIFDGNIFENTQKQNIYFRQPSYANATKNITITNNIIRTCSKTTNNTYANIYISGYDGTTTADNIIISNNQIYNPNTSGNNGNTGIELEYCKDVKINGNSYFNTGTNNFIIHNTCSNVINDDAPANATQSASGLMSATDKVKLDGITLLGVKLNNNALTPDANGYVNIPLMTGATSSANGSAGLVPVPTSADVDKFLAGDGTYKSGGLPMVILSYGHSTWQDFIDAYNNNVIVYARASSNSNPASGSQTRMAFMAYVNNATTPTEVEFQYYRSMNAHSATAMGDQVFVYKLNKNNGWSVTTRDASIKQIKIDKNDPGTVSWSGNVVTLKSGLPKVTSADEGKILKVVNGVWTAVDP